VKYVSCFLLLCFACAADTITLRDGKVLNGSYLGGDSRTVRFAVGDQVRSFDVERISSVSFGEPGQSYSSKPARVAPPTGPVLPTGTILNIRMIDSVDSRRDSVGQTFRASLDDPVRDANGELLIARGADVVVKLVDDQQSGKIAGRTVLTLDLESIVVGGNTVQINTSNVKEESSSRGARSGKVIGGTAVLGTIVGAIAGGGKGAAIGAGSGAALGTGIELATKGEKVHVPSEARLSFTLQQPVALP
jgi:hypothetical protein